MKSPVALTMALLLGMGVISAPLAVEDAAHGSPGVRPGAETDDACGHAIDRSTDLNAWELFEGADACAREQVADEAVFLLLAGQVRASADMGVLVPVSGAAMGAIAELYGAVFYRYGGSGPDELFRDAARANAMFERIRTWRPAFSASYSPGWDYKGPVASERYQAMVEHSRESRLAMLQSVRNLLENDQYYAAHKERGELLARNNNTVVHGTDGTDDGDRILELDALLKAISSSIPRVPEPPLPPELRWEEPAEFDAWLEELGVKD